jgi:DNA-binding CsgD family transcriptional regulator
VDWPSLYIGRRTRHVGLRSGGTSTGSKTTAYPQSDAQTTGGARGVQAGRPANGRIPRTSDVSIGLLKRAPREADTECVDAAERREILNRYRDHSRRFEAAAARRGGKTTGSVIPFTPPPALRELEQEPTAREIEVLQLVADGLVNREIGQHLFLSEETVKSHVRHLLAKLQARSRAHAVAVGFRRGLIA